jgi:hypothetical protein
MLWLASLIELMNRGKGVARQAILFDFSLVFWKGVKMRKIVAVMLAAACAVALITGLNTSAFAAGTWSISPAGTFNGTNAITITDPVTNWQITCTSSDTGKVPVAGSGLSGTGIFEITGISFNCKGPLNLTFTVTCSGFPWPIDAQSYSNGVTAVTIHGIRCHLSGAGCSADIGGVDPTGLYTGTVATGNVTGTYTNSTAKLQVSGGDLHFWNVGAFPNDCSGSIATSDPATVSGTFTFTPIPPNTTAPVITSP